MADQEKEIICTKCNVPLTEGKVKFLYLGYELHANVPKCPECGQVYLSESLVMEKVHGIEASVEDK